MLWKVPWTCRKSYVRMTINTVSVDYAEEGALNVLHRLRYDDNNYSLCRLICGSGLDLSHILRYDDNNYTLCRICRGSGLGPVAQATL